MLLNLSTGLCPVVTLANLSQVVAKLMVISYMS